MGTRLSAALQPVSAPRGEAREAAAEWRGVPSDTDSLNGLDRREDIAQFPYVEFTGRDSITCPSCQGTGRMPSGQVNELVALIPYSDQRLRPQRTKLYVVLSVVLCLLATGLGAFFLFPRSVIVLFDGVRAVTVHFDPVEQRVLMKLTSTLNFSNPNFFSVSVQSLSCQVLYMKTVVGTSQMDNVTTILPLSLAQVLSPIYNTTCRELFWVFLVSLQTSPRATNMLFHCTPQSKLLFCLCLPPHSKNVKCHSIPIIECADLFNVPKGELHSKHGAWKQRILLVVSHLEQLYSSMCTSCAFAIKSLCLFQYVLHHALHQGS
uniref:Transmembrane protein 106C n=1 Tax=Neogobius melanostomus TaxID=47308 RepID=A0A8C6TRP4_9GOBI